MGSLLAFAMGEANRGKEPMVFDWDKAALILKERGFPDAYAGLENDFEWTGGKIFKDGKPVMDSYTYLSSTWARPILSIGDEAIPCYTMQSEHPEWNHHTKWPRSSLDILGVLVGGTK